MELGKISKELWDMLSKQSSNKEGCQYHEAFSKMTSGTVAYPAECGYSVSIDKNGNVVWKEIPLEDFYDFDTD